MTTKEVLKKSGFKGKIESAVLNADFWDALGKAEGWGVMKCAACGTPAELTSEFKETGKGQQFQMCKVCKKDEPHDLDKAPIFYWHDMVDFLSNRKTVEDYFESL